MYIHMYARYTVLAVTASVKIVTHFVKIEYFSFLNNLNGHMILSFVNTTADLIKGLA